MNIGIIGYGRKHSALTTTYNAISDFTAIKSDGLKKLCELENNPKEIADELFDICYSGFSGTEASDIKDCATELYGKHQYELACIALNKINYEDSQLFKTYSLDGETVSSMDKLKDAFYISKITLLSKKKVLKYHVFGVDLSCNTITFNGAKYSMQTKVLARNNPFDFKVVDVNFIIDKKEGN